MSLVQNTLCFNYFDALFPNWTQEADWWEHVNMEYLLFTSLWFFKKTYKVYNECKSWADLLCSMN